MPKLSPLVLLFALVCLGAGIGVFFQQKKPAVTPVPIKGQRSSLPPLPEKKAGEEAVPVPKDDPQAQITLLEGQVEYLQGQVSALQEENSQLLQKLGTLGMKGTPQMDPLPQDDDPPDFVGMGIELMKFRKIHALPVPTVGASEAEVEQAILKWMRKEQPGDEGPRFALALTALGVIEKPVDPLPLRAAMWARQLGGWYDQDQGTILITQENDIPGRPVADRPLAIAFGQLLREYGSTLFPEKREERLTTDERLAREALLAGDAGLTRFLFSLQNPEAAPKSDLPAEDPDHPLNEVPMPVFLRELTMFPFRPGFDFAQTLHSAGDFAQLNAAYSRPPRDCAEIIEAERYLENAALPATRPEFANVKVGDSSPYWDDSMGRFAIFNVLRSYNSDEDAGQAARGWKSDRLLAYAAPDQKRDHVAWQTLWMTPANAEAFFKTLRNCLLQRYDVEASKDTAELLELEAQGRRVTLLRNRSGQGVLLLDTASPDFSKSLLSTLESSSKSGQ